MTAPQASLDDASPGTPTPRQRRMKFATRVAAIVAALGLTASLVFAGLWWYAAAGPGAQAAAMRDEALSAARQIAVNLQSLDYHSVDKGLDVWEASATGPLLDEFRKNHAQYADDIRKLQISTRARLVDVALTDLDRFAGKARALAAVDVTSTQTVNGNPSPPVTKQVRMQLDLMGTSDGGWKATAAQPIAS